MPTANIDPTWIQTGELGLAFAVIVLAAWLVVYVMRTSQAREAKLMELLMQLQPAMTELVDKIGHMDGRLKEIEQYVKKRKPVKSKL